MIKLPVKKLKNGMVTAQSIYNSRGASFLSKGISLNSQYIQRLEQIGIEDVNVTSLDPALKLAPPEDVVQEKTRISAIHKIFDVFQMVESEGTFSLDALQDISETILLDLIAQRRNLVQLTDIRLHDTYTFAHSVNVAILSAMLGLLCHYSKRNLLELTLGGLLHDIGKIVVPADILNKPGRLTEHEMNFVRLHPEAGRQRLKKLNPAATMLSTIALQHHEHIDGNGYPNHLKDKQIHRFSRIVAIADVYDALTSTRPYKNAYTPSVAYRIMMTCSEGQFDKKLLQLFFDNVAVYPVGTILKTRLGYAIVKEIAFGQTLTPIICVFADKDGKPLKDVFHVDLAQCPDDTIDSVLTDSELYHFIHHINIDPAVFLSE